MFTANKYVLAESLEEAYQLNQDKNNIILGGTLWLKLSSRHVDTAIDLSGLQLDTIEEKEDCFKIGCMCTLRDVETHKGVNTYFNGFLATAVENIVGVQFRNGATIGGSVYSRFAFSDVLTALLALDTSVELYQGGIVPLAQFMEMPKDRDILVRIIINKKFRNACYSSIRMSATDFPILSCAVSKDQEQWNIVLGARPDRAKLMEFKLPAKPEESDFKDMMNETIQRVEFGTNNRGSSEYRQMLAGVMMLRGIEILQGGGHYAN
ncbi:MAG: FAD binding domain-containing protein [Anaerovoracaceae bacterium]|jgi:putative selenate reductase FAD-binding subunit